MRVALYARYSSDLQNQRSAEDQFAAIRSVIQARGWSEVACFADEASLAPTWPTAPASRACYGRPSVAASTSS